MLNSAWKKPYEKVHLFNAGIRISFDASQKTIMTLPTKNS